jgi:hypothetical protein
MHYTFILPFLLKLKLFQKSQKSWPCACPNFLPHSSITYTHHLHINSFSYLVECTEPFIRGRTLNYPHSASYLPKSPRKRSDSFLWIHSYYIILNTTRFPCCIICVFGGQKLCVKMCQVLQRQRFYWSTV